MIWQNLGTGWQMLQATRNPMACKQKYLAAERRAQRGSDLCYG